MIISKYIHFINQKMDNKSVYIVWKVEFIRATHDDGYCSGGENYEEISEGVVDVTYSISKENYDCLVSLQHIKNIFDLFCMEEILLVQKFKRSLICHGSGYCDPSINGLNHEMLILLVKPLYYIFNKSLDLNFSEIFDDINDDTELNGNSKELEKILTNIRENIKVVVTTLICMRYMGLNNDICKLIGRLMSTTKLFRK
jgi:hypothetical protein